MKEFIIEMSAIEYIRRLKFIVIVFFQEVNS